ncbi:unnamed protein product [Ranitomeya imitator]|uniref:Protein Wnt n=1 Tax=Ranitomeya imitator TaxID=111125 RepID=A0ABN9M2J1_9NEOB|nr:unnamed protein product [Ranitomeya imitator]
MLAELRLRTDKLRLCRRSSVKTRRGRHHMKIGGARPGRDSRRTRTAAGPSLGYIGGLSTAFQNAVGSRFGVALTSPLSQIPDLRERGTDLGRAADAASSVRGALQKTGASPDFPITSIIPPMDGLHTLHFLWLFSAAPVLAGYPIWWSLALGQHYSSLGSQPILCGSIPGLVPKQIRFCRNYIEIMPSVAEGVKLGIQECQHQFRGRRWNCTTIHDSLAIFGPVLDKATRESAFVHAIASAGVAFAVTRSCAEGSSTICGCDSHHKGSSGEGWKWGGCSEDADFGVLVSREFADARENRPDARSAMNRHNNEAGRATILDHMHLKCKCHGLSGSCEVKTCWWSQPDFRAIGDHLKDKYDSASEMSVEKHRESRGWVETLRAKYSLFKPPTERDLVYYETSPNFCDPNPETGSFGTRGRSCNLTSHGIDGCDLLCCGRGHNTRTEKRKEKCHCIFHWCCYVSCQECVRIYDVHTCK